MERFENAKKLGETLLCFFVPTLTEEETTFVKDHIPKYFEIILRHSRTI